MTEKRPTRRRWLRFSLRTLFVASLLIGFGCAWLGLQLQQKRRHEEVVNETLKLGGHVEIPNAAEVPVWKEWLFGRYAVEPVYLNLSDTNATDSLLYQIQGMNLASLGLRSTKVTDAGLANFKGLTILGELYLDNTQVTDAGLTQLKGLTGLAVLTLQNTQVTDAGLTQLSGLTGLGTLYLRGTQVTQEGVDRLQKAIPSCEIIYSPTPVNFEKNF